MKLNLMQTMRARRKMGLSLLGRGTAAPGSYLQTVVVVSGTFDEYTQSPSAKYSKVGTSSSGDHILGGYTVIVVEIL